MGSASGSLSVTVLQPEDADAVVRLWERCGLTRPWNDPRADIVLAMRGANSTVLVGREAAAIVATAMVGHDGHRGWIYYVAVDPQYRDRDFGRDIVTFAENWLRERGLSKVELLVRPGNSEVCGFYQALGYAVEPRIVMTKRLDGRAPTA